MSSMNLDQITCPNCNQQFPMSEAMAGKLKADLESQLQQRIVQETERLQAEAVKKAEQSVAVELADLKAIATEKSQMVTEFQAQELQMRKSMRELEEKSQAMELEVARQLDEARKQVEIDTTKKIMEEKRLQDLENEKKINDYKAQVEELKHKMEVGSQQSRGEILELDLENLLRTEFTSDEITPVGKGVMGADLIQHVRNRNGQLCEKIIWEFKRVKNWEDKWVDKLKTDSRQMNGFVNVIVTNTLPAGVENFAYYNGVWVTNYQSILGLATALRMQIIHVCHVRDSMTGKGEKMSMLYDYLIGHQFRDKFEAIVVTFQSMRTDLTKEKESMRRQWAKREKEIERITDNAIGIYGEMQGLIGSSLPTLPALEVLAIEEGDSEEQL